MPDVFYDRFNPAPGVKVAPYLKPRTHDLNKTQRIGEHGVLRYHGAMGLGMHSTSDATRNAVRMGDNARCPDKYNVPVSTHGPGVRPMGKIRQAKPRKHNNICTLRIPKFKQDQKHIFEKSLKTLRDLWFSINRRTLQRNQTQLEELYESKRANFIRLYELTGARAVHQLESK